MNDIRKLLSGAFPPPEDEPQHREVIGAAMEWGDRRRRRDWTLTAAAALAVVAVGAGTAAMSGGGSSSTTALGSGPTAPHRSGPPIAPGTAGTQYCNMPNVPTTVSSGEFCTLYNEEQNFPTAFARGSVPYVQAALPEGFTVKALNTDTSALILTGPKGTNYLFVSATSASTLDGRPPGCGSSPQGCVQTSTAGGTVVVRDLPSAGRSAGFVKDKLQDPRITVMVGTKAAGGLNGVAAPTADQMLTDEQLVKITGNEAFVQYASTQWAHYLSIEAKLRTLMPPSATASGGWSPTGLPSSGTGPASSGTTASPGSSGSSAPSSGTGSASGAPSGPGSASDSQVWWPSSAGSGPSSWPTSSPFGSGSTGGTESAPSTGDGSVPGTPLGGTGTASSGS